MQTKTMAATALAAAAAIVMAVLLLGVPSGTPGTFEAFATDTTPRVPSVSDIKKPLSKIAFGSCNDQSMDQPLWPNIAAHEPELWLWMGDNVRFV